jgi:stearoyl-CoA desaturase (delta-9 desaturase)
MLEAVDLTRSSQRPASLRGSGGKLAHKAHAALTVVLPTAAVFYAIWMTFMQAVQTWQVYLLLSCYFITTLAITVGFHRMLTHRAFEAAASVKIALSIVACMAAQGPPIYWVSNHRCHHRYADRDGDPHSPLVSGGLSMGAWSGFWHAHVGWTFGHDLSNSMEFSPDLLKDAVVRWVGRHYFLWVIFGLLLPGLVGFAIESSWAGFAQGIVWGGLARMFLTNQFTNGINSAAHMWGYQRYDTGDGSRNNWFLGIFTLGEGWHNNHHANWGSAIFSRAWYEIDIGGMFVLLLEQLGLARNVRRAGRNSSRRHAGTEKADDRQSKEFNNER